jgi:hypothetical protein
MGTLKHLRTGADVPLAARHIVGRSRTCRLQLDHASVSALHAELTWDGRNWSVRDRGSRNGTFVDGRRIEAGQQVDLGVGMEIGFGVREGQYRFADPSPPHLIAFGPDGSLVAENDVLCLPSQAQCDVMIFRDADERWVAERPEGTSPISDEECVVVGGIPFHVHLPGGIPATREADDIAAIAIDEGVIEFRVSRDREHVDICFVRSEETRTIETRAHGFLLLALARSRLTDAAGGLPETEHGWVHRDDLLRELSIDDPQLLNLWVYRARQQLAQLKLRGASRVIERREGAGQLRLGLSRIRIVDA